MAKINVSEFVIEVGFQEKVTAGLNKLESHVAAVSHKIETNLNKPFAKDYSKNLIQTFDKIEKKSNEVSRNINTHFKNAFDLRVGNAHMFDDMIANGRRAAKDIRNALRASTQGLDLGGRRGSGHGAGGSGGGSGNPPRPRRGSLSEAQRLESRFTNSAAFRRLEMSGGQNTVFARQMQARAAAIAARNAGNSENLRREFARLTQQLREHEQAVRRDSRATQDHARSEEQGSRRGRRGTPGNSSRDRESGGSGAMGVMKGVLASNAVTWAISKSVELAHDAFEKGSERQQATTMVQTGVGEKEAPAVIAKLNKYANDFGVDQTQAMHDFATQRAVFSKEQFSNDRLLDLMRQTSVFAHSSGVSNDAVSRANVQLSQISGGTKISKADLNALQNSIPEWAKVVGQGMSKSADWVKQHYKDISPKQFMDAWQKGLTVLNQQSGAELKAMQSIQAQSGRLANAWNNDLIAMFQGTGTSIGGWMDKLTAGLIALEPAFRSVGKGIGWVSDKLDTSFGKFGDLKKAMGELWDSFSPEQQEALKTVGSWIDKIATALINAPFEAFNAAIDDFITMIKAFTDWNHGDHSKQLMKTDDRPVGQMVQETLFGDDSPIMNTARDFGFFGGKAAKPQKTNSDKADLLSGTAYKPFDYKSYDLMSQNSKAAQSAPLQLQIKQPDWKAPEPVKLILSDSFGNFVTQADLKFALSDAKDAIMVNASPLTGWNKGNRPSVAKFPEQAPAGAK